MRITNPLKRDSARKIIGYIGIGISSTRKEPMMTDWHKRLEEVTGYQTFKPVQLASLEALDRQENVVNIIPTCGVKSLIYQIIQYNESGVTLIISPLFSLMQVQES